MLENKLSWFFNVLIRESWDSGTILFRSHHDMAMLQPSSWREVKGPINLFKKKKNFTASIIYHCEINISQLCFFYFTVGTIITYVQLQQKLFLAKLSL